MEGDTAPRLGLAIDTTADPALTEPESGFTEIDDDSPILGRTVYQPVNAGQDHDRIPAQTIAHEPRLLSPILASPSLSEARDAEQDVASGSEPAAPSSSQENLLQQVLRMRGSDLSNGAENRKFSDLFSNADEGTIQVVLGATPVLESSAAEQWTHGPTQPIEFTTPRAEELNDALGHTPGSFNQDDSVSAILGPKSSQGTSSASTSTPNARQHQFTLDSEAREEINEILMFYNSHLVTREMGFEFQQQVATISPEIAQSEAWASPKETRMFLRRVLDSNAPSEIPAPIELPQEVAVPEFLSPRSEPTPPSARSITYPYEGTPEGDDWQPGFATVHLGPEVPAKDMVDSPSAQQIYRQDSATSAPGDLQQEYWSAVDSRGMVTHKPAPPPKDSAHGSFSGLGLNLSPVDGSAQGLGLGFGANTERSYSVPAVPAHSPPPPPLPPQPASARDYSITYPPPLPFASPPPLPRSPGAQIRVTHVSSYANPLVESPTAPTGKRRVDRVSADSTHATQTTRLSIEAAAQYPGTIKHRRSYSANTTITKDASSGRPSLEPSTTASSTTVVDSGVSAQTKRLNTRKNIIKELVDTEYSYNQDMVILEDIYKGTAAPILNKEDMKTLFGNLDAVRSLSTKFLDALKKAAAPVYTLPKSSRWNYKRGSFSTSMSGLNDSFDKSTEDLSEDDRDAKDRETRIGKVFSEYLPDLERTYGDYLRNRNRANQRFAELQKEDSVKLWLNECAESAKDLTSHPTLDSFLLKPFQRITRYPLLLSSLQGVTPQDHPDRQDVDIAYDSVMHATSTINSRQKREDIVQQVMLGQTAQSKDRQKGGLGKLMKPKTGKVQQHLGFVNYVEDQEYDAIAQRFGGHFFQLQIVMRDIEKYLDDVTDYVAWFTRFSENMSEYLDTSYASNHEMEARWNTFGQTAKSIQQNLLDTHVSAEILGHVIRSKTDCLQRKEVRRIVIEPIVTLWKQHEGPQRMMQKRKKRVPEYARYKDMLEKKMKPDKRMEQQAEEFTAINETLKEELPKLYTLTKLLIESCLCRFVNIQAKWQGAWVKTMQKVLSEAATPDMDLDMIMRDCTANFEEVRCETEQLALCNGQARLGLSQFLSPTTTFSEDTRSTHKRPSTNHSRSENNFSFSSPNTTNRLSGGHSPLAGAFPTPAEQYQANRMRATSAATSRSPATPQKTTYTPPQSAFPSRPATAAAHHNDLSPNVTWPSNEHQYNQRPRSSSNYLVPDPGFTALNSPTRVSPNFAAEVEAERRYRERVLQEQAAYQDIAAREWYTNGSQQDRPQRPRSKVFSSAMSDPAEAIPPSPAEDEEEEINVMFLAASLFEFRIDPNRTEAGYPYLRYAPGEVSRRSESNLFDEDLEC